MPRYRKLHTQTTQSLDVNDMPDDFTRLLWVMLPLALCREGRGMDNPSWVRSNIFPIRLDVTLKMIGGAMDWYAEHGMITRYAVNGRSFFLVPTFHKYQGNTVKETVSIYPGPPDDQLQTNAIPAPDLVPTESIPTPDLVQTDAIPTPEEVLTDSSTDSILNTQYSDSDSDSKAEAEAVFNSEVSPKTSPPSLFPKISASPEKNTALIALREKHGADPLTGMFKFAQRREAKSKGRPPGWGSVSADVWSVCELVAEQFPCVLPVARRDYNASTREMALQHIDKWTGGATFLLEKFNGDVKRTLDALATFRRDWDGGFTVAGPQSLVNSLHSSATGYRPARQSRSKRGGRAEGYESHSDAERADAWEQYGDDLERYIEERGGDENIWNMAAEFAHRIGRDIDVAHMVLEARTVKASLAEAPLDPAAFFAE